MAVSAIAASQPAIAATQSTAGRRSTLEQLLGGLGSFRTALRSFGILGNSQPTAPATPKPTRPDGAGPAGVVAAAQLLLPAPSSFDAPASSDASSTASSSRASAAASSASSFSVTASSSSSAGASASPTGYTATGNAVFRQAASARTLDLHV